MELIQHEITVDRYTKVILSIPKELDAIELKALATKANKLFALSELQMSDKVTVPQKQHRIDFMGNPEKVQFLKEQMDKKLLAKQITDNFNKHFNTDMTRQNIYNKISYLRKKGMHR